MDDLSLVSEAFLDERHTVPVTASFLSAAVSSASNPGGITGHLLNFNGTAAYALIGFLAFAEAALMVGFFFPGETAVVIGGVLAGLGRVNLGVMIVVVVLCAVTGDSVGYEGAKRLAHGCSSTGRSRVRQPSSTRSECSSATADRRCSSVGSPRSLGQ